MQTPHPDPAGAASAAPHASRSAPLCSDCAFRLGSRCDHPTAPIDPVLGTPEVKVEHMRFAQGTKYVPRSVDVCGPEGRLFVRADRAGQLAQPIRQLVQRPAHVVLQDVGLNVEQIRY